MKDFSEMTDQEYLDAVEFAKDEPDSRFRTFILRTAGFNFFQQGNLVCTPKYILYAKYKHYPRQLELLEAGNHSKYVRKVKPDFDTINDNLWEQSE